MLRVTDRKTERVAGISTAASIRVPQIFIRPIMSRTFQNTAHNSFPTWHSPLVGVFSLRQATKMFGLMKDV